MLRYTLILAVGLSALWAGAQVKAEILPPYLENPSNKWVDSLMSVLTPEEKIGQLFMIAAYSNKDETHYREIEQFVRNYKLGGLIFMQGTPQKQAELINRYQSVARIPLIIGFDGEFGLSMRLQNVISYPRQLLLGAIQNDLLIYEMGREFARQMKLAGIHVNFAPVIDVNNNPANPVINDRSFGEQVPNVIRKSIMYMKGLQDGGILACAKHFPGHGDTETDSHYDLPVLDHSRSRLDSVELRPFRALAANGVGSMMVAHLNVPALDNTKGLPTTLSSKVVNDILRKDFNYKGLVFTDALNMKGVSKYFPSGIAEVRALLAGNDVLLFSDKVPAAIEGVLKAVREGTISQALIDEKVRKILLAKYWLGLNRFQQLEPAKLDQEINSEYARYLKERLHMEAITVVTDQGKQIPVGDLSRYNIAAVHISGSRDNTFAAMLDKYAGVQHFYISKEATYKEFQDLQEQLKSYNLVIIGHQGLSRQASRKFGLTDMSIQFIQQLDASNNTINVFFGSPYALNYLKPLKTIIVAYSDEDPSLSASAQVIFGGLSATGRLPVSGGSYKAAWGINTQGGIRLRYVHPLYVGVRPAALTAIDKLANEAIRIGATPGCQVLVAYRGAVIYEKGFGKHTREGNRSVRITDLYDIASITKITATAPVLMHMNEQGWLDIEKRLGDFLPELKGNKRNLMLRDILVHQSGLPAWIPFYKNTLTGRNMPDPDIYHAARDDRYSVPVAKDMYMDARYIDTLYKEIDEAPLQEAKYRYSDLGYYYFKKIIEKQFHKELDQVTDSLIWKRLGGNQTMFNPLTRNIPLDRIVPTEVDKSFRMQTIQGYVHDQGAAMLGGVAGHAGFFSTANDLAKYFQMLLNKGTYGTVRFFQPALVDRFTERVSKGNRRALAFDKSVQGGGDGPSCPCVSEASFGHTGFTGTIAWADPKNEVIFIFLSNRTYPDAENRLLINQNIRPRMQEIIYNAIGD